MKLVRFALSAAPGARLGLLADDRVIDLTGAAVRRGLAWAVPMLTDIRLFLLAGPYAQELALRLTADAIIPDLSLADIHLLAPIESGSKILAHVVNYPGHDKEARVKPPEKPFFFQKPASAVSNPFDPIIAHAMSQKLDHEVELAVVIGRLGRDIAAGSAYDHVAGFAVCNDVSYRDFQMNEDFPELNASYGKNWTQAKGLDFACPLGPAIVLRDELSVPYPLRITCRVNGEMRTDASTGRMIHKVPALIAEISRGMTLYPGDVILTGAPAGGGLGTGKFLGPGDIVECEIERIGLIRNQVIADRPARNERGAEQLAWEIGRV